jgi:hypothetical protein
MGKEIWEKGGEKMNCNCIKDIEGMLKERFGEIKFTNLRHSININSGNARTNLTPLEFRYHPKKKDGSPSKKTEASYIQFSYCPFCGEKSDN